MKPFSNAASTTISDLTLESDEDHFVISGNLEFRRDQVSRANLAKLRSFLDEAEACYAAMGQLPETDSGVDPDAVTTRANPFA